MGLTSGLLVSCSATVEPMHSLAAEASAIVAFSARQLRSCVNGDVASVQLPARSGQASLHEHEMALESPLQQTPLQSRTKCSNGFLGSSLHQGLLPLMSLCRSLCCEYCL